MPALPDSFDFAASGRRVFAVEANALALTCRRFHAERVGDNPPIT